MSRKSGFNAIVVSSYKHQEMCCFITALQGRHNERDGVSNHQPHDYLLQRLFRRRSKTTTKLRVTGVCEWNSPVTGEYSTQKASNAANVSIWRRHRRRSCTLIASFHAIIVCIVRMRYGEIYFTILNISRLRQNGHHCANEIVQLASSVSPLRF